MVHSKREMGCEEKFDNHFRSIIFIPKIADATWMVLFVIAVNSGHPTIIFGGESNCSTYFGST